MFPYLFSPAAEETTTSGKYWCSCFLLWFLLIHFTNLFYLFLTFPSCFQRQRSRLLLVNIVCLFSHPVLLLLLPYVFFFIYIYNISYIFALFKFQHQGNQPLLVNIFFANFYQFNLSICTFFVHF